MSGASAILKKLELRNRLQLAVWVVRKAEGTPIAATGEARDG